MTNCVPTLLELQRAVRLDLLGIADSDASEFVVPDGLDPQARLAIYRNTANGTLLAALMLSYPAVRSLVGPNSSKARLDFLLSNAHRRERS